MTGWELDDEDSDGGFRERYERSFELCQLCEELGFDYIALGQHRFTPEAVNPSALLTVLSALAARTKTIRFVTSIFILPLYNAVDVAEEVATIDDMTGGRFVLGVAIGYRPYEYERIGLDYRQRVFRFEEGVEVLRRCWSDGPATFTGEHYTVMDADVHPAPAQPGGPRIWIGAQAPAAIMRAARIGDGWMTDNVFPAETMVPIVEQYRSEARAHGRPDTLVLNRRIAIGPTRDYVEDRWLPEILDFYGMYRTLGIPLEPGFLEKAERGERVRLDDISDTLVVGGTPEDCIRSLQKIDGLLAPDYVTADFGAGAHGKQYEDLRDAIEMFGREVLPAFR